MIEQTEHLEKKQDIAKWTIAIVFFVFALVLNYHFSHIALPLRWIAWIGVFSILISLTLWTTQGKTARLFLGDARMELRKVVWPSHQETMQTTGLIILLVLIFALIMWALDSVMLFIIGKLTG